MVLLPIGCLVLLKFNFLDSTSGGTTINANANVIERPIIVQSEW